MEETLSEELLAKRIKQARVGARLTQDELAHAVGVDQTWVSRAEDSARITTLQLSRIAHATGRPIDFFLRPEPSQANVMLRADPEAPAATQAAIEWAHGLLEDYQRLRELAK